MDRVGHPSLGRLRTTCLCLGVLGEPQPDPIRVISERFAGSLIEAFESAHGSLLSPCDRTTPRKLDIDGHELGSGAVWLLGACAPKPFAFKTSDSDLRCGFSHFVKLEPKRRG